jgi:hypothetical protein
MVCDLLLVTHSLSKSTSLPFTLSYTEEEEEDPGLIPSDIAVKTIIELNAHRFSRAAALSFIVSLVSVYLTKGISIS